MYVIITKIHDLTYYMRKSDDEHRSKTGQRWEVRGVKNNATKYETEQEAKDEIPNLHKWREYKVEKY